MFKNASLQFKIIFSVVVYIVIIGVIGNVFVFVHLQKAVSRKSEQMDRVYMEAVRFQLDRNFANVFSLAAICAADPAVSQIVSRRNWTEHKVIVDSIKVQDQINAFLQASPGNPYIDKLILFDNNGLFVQAQGRQIGGSQSDPDNIRQLPLYARFIADNSPWVAGFGKSILIPYKRDCYTLFFRIRGSYRNNAEAYLYVEAGIDMITNVFRDYGAPPGVFARIPETGEVIMQDNPQLVRPDAGNPGYVPQDTEFPYRFRQGGRSYRLDRMPLENELLVLYNQADETNIAVDDRQTFYTVLAAILLSLCAAAGLALFLSAFFTRPIHALISRIRKISEENNFSPDPDIESRGDELGRIGRAVNEMSGSIARYLAKIEEQYREQKNAEIALLQTQINPHFIYNTLDSIQWMAKIQNNSSIADITRRLSNLLRSIASATGAGGSNKITLADELLILDDYVEIMSVRFMGNFEMTNRIPETFLDCRIPRLTLQPLVENAILHGIKPSDKFGLITLNAASGGGYLDITVEDSGAGMSREQLETVKIRNREKSGNSPSLNRIGIANVDERLKLLYGESCGLFFESILGEYTRVTVRILEER